MAIVQSEFEKFVEENVENFSIVGVYVDKKTPILIQHDICGYKFENQPQSFRLRQKCPKCTKEEKRIENRDSFLSEIDSSFSNPKDDYKTNKENMTLFHSVCGKEFETKPNNFRPSHTCKICNKKYGKLYVKPSEGGTRVKTNLTIDIIKERLQDNLKIISFVEPIKATSDIKVECKCGNVYTTNSNTITSGKNCKKCQYIKLKNERSFLEQDIRDSVNNLLGDEYEIVEPFEYDNSHTKYKFLHKRCNKIWEQTITHIKAGTRCSCLKRSKGEEIIEKILNDLEISFEQQFSIQECKYINTLRFDFGGIKFGNRILLIEYDGIQHFKPCFGTTREEKMETFKITQLRDEAKNKFIKENNEKYELIRFNYTDREQQIKEQIYKLLKI